MQKIAAKLIKLNTGQIEGVPANPRAIKKKELASLAKSIEETPELFNMRPCIVYDNGDEYVVLGGNMRYRAATELLHWEEIPCEIVSRETSTEKLRAIVIKDNGAWGEWDMDALGNEWDEMPLNEWGVVDVPFECEKQDTASVQEVQEDNFDPDQHYETKVKRGEVWQLGDHRLMCGDSTSAEDVATLMNGERADLWITDPPYNVSYEGGTGLTIQNDKMSDSDFVKFLSSAFASAMNVAKAGCPFYIWAADKSFFQFLLAANEQKMKMRQILIWNKSQFTLGLSDYQAKHEPCLYGWKEGAHYFVNARNRTTVYDGAVIPDYRKMKKNELVQLLDQIYLEAAVPSTVINCPKPQRSADHPTMKPVRLFGYQIANSSRPGDIILDTFGGSGTTIVASEQLGRCARLMELDPHYCDVIIARWEKLTGRKATIRKQRTENKCR